MFISLTDIESDYLRALLEKQKLEVDFDGDHNRFLSSAIEDLINRLTKEEKSK